MNKTRKHVLGSGDNIFLIWNTFINLEWATSGGGKSAARDGEFCSREISPIYRIQKGVS
jgi:hypothetical protein